MVQDVYVFGDLHVWAAVSLKRSVSFKPFLVLSMLPNLSKPSSRSMVEEEHIHS